jgi:thiosulfate dehydrogenase
MTLVLWILGLALSFALGLSWGRSSNQGHLDIAQFVHSMGSVDHVKTRDEIQYGKDLIARTSFYLGPAGTVRKLTQSRMNCQNCHLNAGTKQFGNSFFQSHALYPRYRPREGKILTLADRVNNCIERNLNGIPLSYDSREMRAMLAYFKWLSSGQQVIDRDLDTRLGKITFPKRAADPKKGEVVFQKHCVVCHGSDGQGKLTEDGISYSFPPLWGDQSYQVGGSMFMVSRFARFVKYNMPFGMVDEKPLLTDEEALDVAAFVNDDGVHPRPFPKRGLDYPYPEDKPFDYPFGPFADPFSELRHKFGPFPEIIELRKRHP